MVLAARQAWPVLGAACTTRRLWLLRAVHTRLATARYVFTVLRQRQRADATYSEASGHMCDGAVYGQATPRRETSLLLVLLYLHGTCGASFSAAQLQRLSTGAIQAAAPIAPRLLEARNPCSD
ncbi:hypothetical protein LMG919_14360 [Xanthomonas vesicatoria]|uniref:Uncharacterized protein n=1 Tax=Xanthomonas vesicatoria ATCC 35937 TaxID=925775 RepID=F0BCJ1_9XANT|nr:hypothetical protein XVE_1819 [Xanthomonas vesicatoria ATCC 35937]KTF34814.1 hypothetical protein LMG920_04925 [Xanthomonas vesicatoria]KTF34856.1 hypothetical protein LMG919_14360 [Xanthomonas vesicatoria]